MNSKVRSLSRNDFTYRLAIPTRWDDNDMLGHLNNVLYYRFFEAVLVKFVIEEINLDWRDGILSVQAVESFCQFHHPLSFPEVIDAGLRVAKIGNSSIVFEMALFGPNSQTAAANGHMVEVLVDRNTGKSRPISKDQRVLLEAFMQTK
jgi:acyl-CoA thioester hydrolase